MGTIAGKLSNGIKDGISTIIEAGVTDKEKITLAELSQCDSYKKRARTTVVYAGLTFIFIVYILIHSVPDILGKSNPNSILSNEFWWAWTGVVSMWILSRSYEKSNTPNPFTKIITGTK